MKNFLKISEFQPIHLSADQIDEGILFNGVPEEKINLILISLAPILFGFWRKNAPDSNPISEITFTKKSHPTLLIRGKELYDVPFDNESIVVWQPSNVDFRYQTLFEKIVETRLIHNQSKKSKFKLSLEDIKSLSASYFYPRKIYVVIVESDSYLNIFPMDLHLKSPFSEKYSFSLQTSNRASEVLQKVKKVVIGEISSDHLKLAYSLGKNHGRTNLLEEELEFKTYRSKSFQIQVPVFCKAYREVLISKAYDLNTHTLFMGQIEGEINMADLGKQPYHVHRFHHNFCKKDFF